MMSKNTGKDYEKLTQYIFNQIVNQDSVQNIEVKHDVILQGKSTKHQIDVYWKFEVGGEEYSAIVQAKDWKNKVPQNAMLAFNDIIRDLPLGTRGIFVSTNGYQKGAIDVAKANGITIYELRPPKYEDWEGYIKTLHLQFNVKTPVYENIAIAIDTIWAKEQDPSNLPKAGQFHCSGQNSFYDEKGNAYTNVESVLKQLLEKNPDEIKHAKFNFEQSTFAYINGKYVKIKSIEGDVGYASSTYVHTIDAEDFTSYVLKNIISGNSKMFDQNRILKTPQ